MLISGGAMVLEGVVVDLVNRFLGDFIENLDKSQLSIGIWGGKQRPMPLSLASIAASVSFSTRVR